MINITLTNNQITFNWSNVKNSYDENEITFNGQVISNFYLKNINSNNFSGFYISFNRFSFISENNNIIASYFDEYGEGMGVKTVYNQQSTAVINNLGTEIQCGSESDVVRT